MRLSETGQPRERTCEQCEDDVRRRAKDEQSMGAASLDARIHAEVQRTRDDHADAGAGDHSASTVMPGYATTVSAVCARPTRTNAHATIP